jgi:hypothetical protein
MTAARAIVMINCILFLAFGFAWIVSPARFARAVEIRVSTPTALADLRAMYGGLSLAIGALLLQGLRDPAWFAPSLFLTMATSAGLGGARIYSIAVSGVPNTLVLVGGLALEILSFTWAVVAYRGL